MQVDNILNNIIIMRINQRYFFPPNYNTHTTLNLFDMLQENGNFISLNYFVLIVTNNTTALLVERFYTKRIRIV